MKMSEKLTGRKPVVTEPVIVTPEPSFDDVSRSIGTFGSFAGSQAESEGNSTRLGNILNKLSGLVSPLLSGGLSLISSFFNRKWQREADDLRWQRETEYNHPAAQVERLKEAGLNPALLYGTGTVATGNTHASISSPQMSDLSESMNRSINQNVMRANAKYVEAQADAAQSEAFYKRYENEMLMRVGALRTSPWYHKGAVSAAGAAGKAYDSFRGWMRDYHLKRYR